MDPIFKFPASPGTPLFPVSPERANRQQLPQSPSMPSISYIHNDPFSAHSRGNSDVQGKVAQFNNLSKEAAQRRKDNEAALKRAVLGREEAESETRRLREENGLLRGEVEEGRARERRVGERMEGVLEELQRSNETHAHSQGIYEKEIRRARKEAFKSSSALVKMQEELKSARNKYTLMREEVDVQRRKVESKEQEAFAAQNLLVDLAEEVEKLGQQIKVIEGQKGALKTALKGEEIARIAAEGAVALPPTPEEDEFASPKKTSRHQHRESLKENLDPQAPELEDELVVLRDELRMEKRLRLRADDQVHFMKMECQFQCCSCRVAEKQGVEYVHDDTLAQRMGEMAGKIADEYTPVSEARSVPETTPGPIQGRQPCTPASEIQPAREPTPEPAQNRPSTPTSCQSPESSTKHPSPPPSSPPPSPPPPTSPPHSPTPIQIPTTPQALPLRKPPPPPRTISYTSSTITIPLKDPPIPLTPQPITPRAIPFSPAPLPLTPGGTISREQALEQIRQRRGRARSIAAGNGTPRGKMVVVEGRRDVSAPAGRV